MRLVGYINNERDGKAFSNFLQKENINNQCEITVNTDWGSSDYGNVICKIWVYDEDQFNRASQFYQEFTQNPNDERFQQPMGPQMLLSDEKQPDVVITGKTGKVLKNPNAMPMGVLTFYLLILCSWIFMWGVMTEPNVETLKNLPPNLPLVPLLEPSINKTMVYDYPHAYEIVDHIIDLYESENGVLSPKMEKEAKSLEQEYRHTPYWEGVYSFIMAKMKGNVTSADYISINAPKFEKIGQGEVWRLFTPALLHANFLHILFNMIWLVVLGKQIELRLGTFRYALFVLATGIISNTAQYLMSGANFIGISGVLAAMFGFIWMRQKYAAWEGYQLQKGTIGFILFFFGFMVAIQLISFVTELLWQVSLSPGIANTAHIAGLFSGVIFGRLKYFAWTKI